jgi:CubicO group peptidase (beta-lactamase class C family)
MEIESYPEAAVIMHFPAFAGSGENARRSVWPVDRPDYTSLEAAVQGETARHNVPGIAMGILQDGHIDVAVAGFASFEAHQPVTPNTLFQIGSITKVFTATLVQQLVQEDLLSLDEPVITYLPDLKLSDAEATKQVTLRHLLSHTSGIEGDYFIDLGLGDDAPAKAIAEFPKLKQWNMPGELYAYSNSGFYLTGRIIEVVTGKPFEEVLQEKLLTPLGTPDITQHTYDAILRDHAIGYNLHDRGAGHQIADPFAFSRQVTPAGNLMAPVDQLLRFAQLHLGDGRIEGKRLLDASLTREMRVPSSAAAEGQATFGIGWAIRPVGDEPAVMHNGGTNGFRALLTVLPERDFAVAILTNGSEGDSAHSALNEWALQRYRGVQPKPPAEPVTLPTPQLERWVGTWERHDRQLEIELGDSELVGELITTEPRMVTFTGERTPFQLDPLSETSFRVRSGDLKGLVLDFIEIESDARGNYRALVRHGSRFAERLKKPAAKTAPRSRSRSPRNRKKQ